MAPEQIQAHPSPASDQYALGIVVYEWLCGERPFSGSFAQVAAKQLFVPPPPLHEQVSTISTAVEHVVLKALAKDPKQRFVQIQDFAWALEEASRTQSSTRTILMASTERPAEMRQKRIHHLPALLTPLIGREQDVQAIYAQLVRPEVRLLTLLGTAGIGKTRLSLAVATEMQAHFADGVCFVPLAAIGDPNLVLPTIAQVLDIRESTAQPLFEQVKEVLRVRHLLLLLDNVEQVVKVASQLEDLLAACPGLKLLVTSRTLLHLEVEYVFPVPPLALPDLSQLSESERLTQYGAVALFVRRSQALLPTFQLTPTNARTIAEICVRLDGLPLAIELAAARIRLLPPQALLARLSQRLQVLTSGPHSLPERQQTLRNALKWSYDLLEREEQRLFQRLAVFVGSWTLEAADAVAYAGQPSDTAGVSVLDELASLLDKSLLLQVEQEGEEPRLMMLETVREYGLECLAASGEMEFTRQAHAAYYLALAEEAEPRLEGSPQETMWLKRLGREYDNLRAAMQWSLEPGEAGQTHEMTLRLGGALRGFWLARGYWSEGQNFLKHALVGSQGISRSVRVKAVSAAAQLALKRGDYDQAKVLAEESLGLYRELGDTAGCAFSLSLLGSITLRRDNYAAARSLTEEALVLFRQVGDQENATWCLFNLGIMAIEQADYSRGRGLLEETLRMHREQGSKRGIAASLLRLGWMIHYSQGDPAAERSLLEESLALFRELGDKENIADSLNTLGWVVLQRGEAARAHSLAEESLVLFREMGQRPGIAESLLLLAKVAAVQGNHTEARRLYEESLSLCREKGDKWDVAFGLEGLASVVATQGEGGWAARLWGAAEALREILGSPIPPVYHADYEHGVATTRTQMGEKVFAALWAEGRTMTPEQAVAAQGKATMPTPSPKGSLSTPSAKTLPTALAGLTPREVEVLRLVAQGLTDAQVAEQLVISPRTVNWHLTAIYSKLQVTSRSAATRYAIEHHLT
jgi:predicted ATPase/DNA-binding CsgD family transcriptional regulator